MQTIQVTRADGVVTVVLDRPARKNAVNEQMWTELLATFREIAASGEDRVVVITGAGGEFCSGADLSGEERPRLFLAAMRQVGDVALALHRLPQPTIAKVRGVAVGAGANLAFGCDLVVASENARFAEIFARRGLAVDFGGSWLLPRLVGLHRAKELAFFADEFGASRAEELGLVNRVLPDAELDTFVADWVARLASGPPIALAMTKRMLDNSMNVTFEQALDDETVAQTLALGTADTAEALVAFLEKRTPHFRGC